MYEKEMLTLQNVVKEEVEFEFYETRGDGMHQFRVKSVDGKALAEEDVVLMGVENHIGGWVGAGSGTAAVHVYNQLDIGDYLGKVYVFYCKKKKGLFKKESLKVIKSFNRPFHRSGLESGEEEKICIGELLG